MLHLLPFALGALAGSVVVKIAKKKSIHKHLDSVMNGARDVTITGLNAIEKSTTKLKNKLQNKSNKKEKSVKEKKSDVTEKNSND